MKIGDQKIDPIPCHICDKPVPVGDWELHLTGTHNVKTGERVAESPVTGDRYRVTVWKEHGDGKITALAKEPIDE